MKKVKLINKIIQNWKQDKKVFFLKNLAILSIIGSIFSTMAYHSKPNYVDDQGYLIESFGFIPLAYLFTTIALVSGITLAFISISRRHNNF